MAGPTQPQVIDESWDDDRVRSFLDYAPASADVSADYYVLERAYRSMRATDFARFLTFFRAAGRNLDATGPAGVTVWQVIATHRHGDEYLAARPA